MERSEVTQESHRLGGVGQSAVLQHHSYAGAVVGARPPGVDAQDTNLAGVRALQTLGAFDGRRLACAVGPQDRGHLLVVGSPRHALEGRSFAKTLGQIAHSHGLGHRRSLGHVRAAIGMVIGPRGELGNPY
jgi:hypothetical protein